MKKENTLDTQKKPRLWSSLFLIITLASLMVGVCHMFFSTTMSLYVKSLGGTTGFVGALLTMYTVSATVSRILAGRLTDKKGRRAVAIAGMTIFLIPCILYKFFPSLGGVAVLRIIQGAGYSASTTALSVAITDVIPRERMSEGIGYFGLTSTLTQAVGPAIALGLISGGDFSAAFFAAAAALLVGIILMFFCNYEEKGIHDGRTEPSRERQPEGETSAPKNPIWIYFEKKALPYTFAALFMYISSAATIAYLVLYASEAGIQNIGLYYTISAVFMFAARMTMGRVADKYNPLTVLVPGAALSMLSFLLLILAPAKSVLFFIAAAVSGLGGGMTLPTLNALVIRDVSPQRRGAASATFMVAADVGISIGGIIWGGVIDLTGGGLRGFQTVFAGCMVSMAVAMALMVIIVSKGRRKSMEQAATSAE